MAMVFNILDIGMGDATVMELPMTHGPGPTCIVDYGEYFTPNRTPPRDALKWTMKFIADKSKARGFKDNPVLDYLFITHSDQDHWSRLACLITGSDDDYSTGLWAKYGYPATAKLKIGTMYHGGEWSEYVQKHASAADCILSACAQAYYLADNDHDMVAGDKSVTPRWGAIGGSQVDIYLLSSNFPKRSGGAPNPKSLVLLFRHSGGQFIIPGDAEDAVEALIVDRYKSSTLSLICDGLRLGHHGSRNGTTEKWVDATQPKSIFVSSDAKWSHPYFAAINRVKKRGCLAETPNFWRFFTSYHDDKKDYVSTSTTEMICTTLWFVVTNDQSDPMTDDDGVKKAEPLGTYTGVQYAVTIPLAAAAPYLPIAHTAAFPKAGP
jgi:hypothetical protein